MITRNRFGLVARQLAFVGALLVGCESSDSVKQKLVREGKHSSQMPSWEASKQSEVRMPDIQSDTYMAAGRLHETQGRLTKAAAQYRLAVQARPDDVEAHNRLGLVLCQMRQFKEADAELSKAIKLAPDQTHLHNNLGFSYLVQARWAEAEQQFAKALELNPAFARAHVNMAMVLAQQEKFDESLRHFQVVVPLEDAWFNLGLMYQSKSLQADAARAFKTSLKLNPKMLAAQQCLDKLPADVVGSARPFENVTTLAVAPKAASPVESTLQAAAPVPSVACASHPSSDKQSTPAQPVNENVAKVASGSPATPAPTETTAESAESLEMIAEAPSESEPVLEQPATPKTPEPQMVEAVKPTSASPAVVEEQTAEPFDPELLASLMTAPSTDWSGLLPSAEAMTAATQPENETAQTPVAPVQVARIDPLASPTMSSTSQPSIAAGRLITGTEAKDLFAFGGGLIDLTDDADTESDSDEIVLSARPPMPAAARNVVLQATQPANDMPTPEELRVVIQALIDLSRTQSSEMPKPYSLPTAQPVTEAPQSQPSAETGEVPDQLSMSVEASVDGTPGNWDLSTWNDFDSLFAPGETFGPAASDR